MVGVVTTTVFIVIGMSVVLSNNCDSKVAQERGSQTTELEVELAKDNKDKN